MERIPTPIEITQSQPEATAKSARNGPRRNDIPHLSEAELLAEIVRCNEPTRAP